MSSFSMLLMSALYIFNASQGKYLSIDSNGKASLSSTPMPIELTQTDDGTGRYNDSENPFTWIIKKVNTKDYTIGFQVSDAYATGFLTTCNQPGSISSSSMTPLVDDGIAITYAEPDASYTSGIWQILSQKDVETEEVILNEEYTEYTPPTLAKAYTNVTFTRKFAVNAWNSLCVPFPITQEQIEEQFGQGAKVAIYSKYDMNDKRLYFQTTNTVEAGTPCLLYPTSIHDDKVYTFGGIASSDWATNTEPSEVKKDKQPTYKGTYKNIGKAPMGSYIFGGNNKMYFVDSDVTMKGFRAYFVDENSSVSGAKQLTWGFGDPSTSIEIIPGNDANGSKSSPTDIYKLDGKLVKRKATSTEGLTPGVYIIHGMKVIVK